MRISDWSSDVCSSDLAGLGVAVGIVERGRDRARRRLRRHRHPAAGAFERLDHGRGRRAARNREFRDRRALSLRPADGRGRVESRDRRGAAPRSEEHTSELQSLMRISYAVFCLKKKNRVIEKCQIHKVNTKNYSYETHGIKI